MPPRVEPQIASHTLGRGPWALLGSNPDFFTPPGTPPKPLETKSKTIKIRRGYPLSFAMTRALAAPRGPPRRQQKLKTRSLNAPWNSEARKPSFLNLSPLTFLATYEKQVFFEIIKIHR